MTRRHLLVIGAQRSGTTYLHGLLDAHPAVAMARPVWPEPKVFLSAELAARGRDWYLRTWFAHATDETVLGEKSTSYIEHPEAAGRAAAMLGQPAVIAMLRDPIARAVSNWKFSTTNGVEDRPLVRALAENLAGPRDWDRELTSVSPFAYLERGRYTDYLGPWLQRFPDTTRLVVLEELVATPAAVAGLFRWLGIDPGFRPEGLGRPLNASAPGTFGEPAEGRLPDDLVLELRQYFEGSDQALADLLGRRLPWRPELPTHDDVVTR